MSLTNVNLKMRGVHLDLVVRGCPQCGGDVYHLYNSPTVAVCDRKRVDLARPNRVISGRYYVDVRMHVCKTVTGDQARREYWKGGRS